MAESGPFGTREIDFLAALRDEEVEYLVVGLAAAALQGAPAVTQDVDLWLRDLGDERFHRVLHRFGAAYVPPGSSHGPLMAGGGLSLFDLVVAMHGLEDFDREYRRSVEIRVGRTKVRVLPLDRIIASKRATNRPKDRAILPVLEDAARVIRTAAARKAPARRRKTSRS